MIHIVIIQPFSFTKETFSLETEPFRNAAALEVAFGATDLDPIQFPLFKGILNKCAARLRHDAPSLISLIKPVSDARGPVRPFQMVVSDDTNNLAIVPYGSLDFIELGQNEERNAQ